MTFFLIASYSYLKTHTPSYSRSFAVEVLHVTTRSITQGKTVYYTYSLILIKQDHKSFAYL